MDDRERRVRERAYQIWEEEGRPEDRSHDHWHKASQEMETDPRHPEENVIDQRQQQIDPAGRRRRDPNARTKGNTKQPGRTRKPKPAAPVAE